MNEQDRYICSVCRDEICDPRILPCWHAACLTCILRLTQNSNGSAVACPVCRQTLMFVNIRSLPNPINCATCEKFVMNPRKYPCCNRLRCKECIQATEIDGEAVCVNDCSPSARHKIDDLPAGKLCPVCFAFHTEQAHRCGHFLCRRCKPERQSARCNICIAVASSPPRPVNPFAAVAAPTAPADPNVHHNIWQQTQTQNGIKALIFWFVLLVMLLIYGFCLNTWIVGIITMLILRFNYTLALGTCTVTSFVFIVFSFYYFYHGVTLFLLNQLSNRYLPRLHSAAPLVFQMIVLILVIPNFEPIFLHKAILEVTIAAWAGIARMIRA